MFWMRKHTNRLNTRLPHFWFRAVLVLLTVVFSVRLANRLWTEFQHQIIVSEEKSISTRFGDGDVQRANEFLPRLLKSGYANQRILDRWLWNAAGCKNAASLIRTLLQAGADPNYSPGFRLTTIHRACLTDYRENLELLVKAGADVNSRDGAGNTPLMYVTAGNSPEMISLLLAHDADPNLANKDGETVAKIIGERGYLEAAEAFLRYTIAVRKSDAASSKGQNASQ